MTRTEIIAQLDAEIGRLERARDFLAAALTDSTTRLMRKVEKKLPTKQRKPAAIAVPPPAAHINGVAPRTSAAPPLPPPAKAQPQIQHVPPRRRMERRSLSADKGVKPAALSGQVPMGPVVVSANEARKVQERALPPSPPTIVSEARPEIGAERSLGSLIQAFERRIGMSGIETP